MLAGCGGGGGAAPAFAPPRTATMALREPDQSATAALIRNIEGTGTALIAMVEADDGRFSLIGEDARAHNLLAKLPDPSAESTDLITTRYSRFSHFSGHLSADIDPDRYMLIGRLYQTLPRGQLRYHMTGLWACLGCQHDDSAIHHRARGSLDIHAEQQTATFTLSGSGLDMKAALALQKTGVLASTGKASITFNEQAETITNARLHGGIFGPLGEEAGVLFGINTEDKTFSGAALGFRED